MRHLHDTARMQSRPQSDVPRSATESPPSASVRPSSPRSVPLSSSAAWPMANDYPAIDLPADRPYDRIREFYLYLEPSLLAAIARGDRRQAVRLLNHVLLHIYAAGEERSDLLRGLLVEPVVMMSRAAIAAGSPPTEVLGLTARTLDELVAIEDDEALATWLRRMLDRVVDSIERAGPLSPATPIAAAVTFIREHADQEVTRDDTARAVGVSPGHFSRLLRERTGLTFTALVRQARVELACELLLNTDRPIADIAHACGFYDQSHLTKVFSRSRRVTPRRFREQSREPHRPAGQEPSVVAATVTG
jgi:AraC-like DNA-binding protein